MNMNRTHILQLFVACIMMNALMLSCKKNSNNNSVTPVVYGDIGNGDQEFEITKDTTFKKGVYNLKGWVYVTNGVTITIEPGTIIKGDKDTKASLIIEKGAKIIAQGTKEAPIVFTSAQPKGSRKPGDWGGLIILGNAKNNQTDMQIEGGPRSHHGGNDDNDNSGILQYVRVEFGGDPFKPDQEINGITLGSIGRATTIDHIQVSYSNDDSYEWFGGTVNCKYLVAYHGWDDDFDTDNGFSGKCQFFLGVRNPKIADQSVSNGFESDNNATGSTAQPYTSPIFSNVTFIGPKSQAADFTNNSSYINAGGLNPGNGAGLGVFQATMQIRRNSHLSCYNSVGVGYPVGILIENDKGSQTQSAASGNVDIANAKFAIKNVILGDNDVLGSDKNKSFNDYLCTNGTNEDNTKNSFSHTYFNTTTLNNMIATATSLFTQPNSTLANPNYGPKAGSVLLNKSDLFSDEALKDPFFEKVNYIGAFASDKAADNWTLGWCNFDPQNTDY